MEVLTQTFLQKEWPNILCVSNLIMLIDHRGRSSLFIACHTVFGMWCLEFVQLPSLFQMYSLGQCTTNSGCMWLFHDWLKHICVRKGGPCTQTLFGLCLSLGCKYNMLLFGIKICSIEVSDTIINHNYNFIWFKSVAGIKKVMGEISKNSGIK